MNIAELLLKSLPNSTTPKLDLELLLATALNRPRNFLYTYPKHELTPKQVQTFLTLYNRRRNGEPIAYILGKKEFWSLELLINNKVLIPRPDTELLVTTALKQLANKKATIVDLGTGSGAIALALAWERPNWHIIATDLSIDALKLAQQNAKRFQLTNLEFLYGDWCNALPRKKFDLIISNPPYIATDDPHLQGEIKFEPTLALVAHEGLAAIQKIISQAPQYLQAGGSLILEHGDQQKNQIHTLLQNNNYCQIISYQDLAGIDRVITGSPCQ